MALAHRESMSDVLAGLDGAIHSLVYQSSCLGLRPTEGPLALLRFGKLSNPSVIKPSCHFIHVDAARCSFISITFSYVSMSLGNCLDRVCGPVWVLSGGLVGQVGSLLCPCRRLNASSGLARNAITAHLCPGVYLRFDRWPPTFILTRAD